MKEMGETEREMRARGIHEREQDKMRERDKKSECKREIRYK